MNREVLLGLAERCEAATGPDRELDAAIFRALAGNPTEHWYRLGDKHLTDAICPAPTASIDAAMGLVPEGSGAALFIFPDDPAEAQVGAERVKAATPALALCAAALRAIASIDKASTTLLEGGG